MAPCPPVLGFLPNLRYIELNLQQPQEWLGRFFVDLSFCSCLEALKIAQDHGAKSPHKLPEVQLGTLPKLKRIELRGWLPGTEFTLPHHCKLHVDVESGASCSWDAQWRAMQRHLEVLSLYESDLQGWPAGLERLSQLVYLEMQCTEFWEGDLAVLKAVPHVDLFFYGMASLTLTSGAWQSLEVHSNGGMCIDITDADAFVRGTERFLFMSGGNTDMLQPTCATIRAACNRQLKACYQCNFGHGHGDQPHTIRLSNCEDSMRLEPSKDGKIIPSGGVHDGYAGTPEDSPLWQRIRCKRLVRKEQFWPVWDPRKWVLGK